MGVVSTTAATALFLLFGLNQCEEMTLPNGQTKRLAGKEIDSDPRREVLHRRTKYKRPPRNDQMKPHSVNVSERRCGSYDDIVHHPKWVLSIQNEAFGPRPGHETK